jgi:hypothetical protein
MWNILEAIPTAIILIFGEVKLYVLNGMLSHTTLNSKFALGISGTYLNSKFALGISGTYFLIRALGSGYERNHYSNVGKWKFSVAGWFNLLPNPDDNDLVRLNGHMANELVRLNGQMAILYLALAFTFFYAIPKKEEHQGAMRASTMVTGVLAAAEVYRHVVNYGVDSQLGYNVLLYIMEFWADTIASNYAPFLSGALSGMPYKIFKGIVGIRVMSNTPPFVRIHIIWLVFQLNIAALAKKV